VLKRRFGTNMGYKRNVPLDTYRDIERDAGDEFKLR